MANAIVAYQNRIDESTFASYGSWDASLPLTNLKNRVLSKVARSTDDANASTKMRFSLTKERIVGVVAVVNHNLSTTATWRYRVYSDSGYSTLTYDSGTLDVWPTMPVGYFEWEDDGFWFMKTPEEDRELFTATTIHVPTVTVIAQYYQIEFFDDTNPDGYVQLGRVFVGKKYQPTINMNLGASVGYESRTLVDEALSGSEYFDRRNSFRVARFSLGLLDASDSSLNADLMKVQDTDQECVFVYDADDSIGISRKSFLGRLRTLSPIEQPYATTYQTNYEIKELL
jgi:hypothetical protein